MTVRRITRRAAMLIKVATIAGAVAVAAGAVGSRAAARQQSFSTRVDTVRVDVEVRHGGRLVSGLTAADFEVLDNGVRQSVEIVAASALPVSVVLALDSSASLDAAGRSHLTRASMRVVDELKPGESATLVTFSGRVAIKTAFTADATTLRTLLAAPTPSGDTALYDAAHVAMLMGSSAPGRPLVILFSDGDDTASFLTEDAVIETAERTGTVLSVVTTGGEGRLLQQLAVVTGGVFVKERSIDRVAERFAELLDSFRNRYLLGFAPSGHSQPGWHKLTVRVKGGGEVRARTGYWSGS
jgi:Ca-activated chloride channel family protein